MITIVGAGRIGSTVAANIIPKKLDDILLIDIIQGLPQGEALDLGHMAASFGVDVSLRGTNDYKDMEGSDLVIVTGGLPRKPGMTRLDLLQKNSQIIGDIAQKIKEHAPKSLVLMVTNPLDVMTYVALKKTGFDKNRVFGMSGQLDSCRFRYFIAQTMKVPVSAVHAIVIGEHGESMLPLPQYSTVNGKPLTQLMSKEEIANLIEGTRKTAADVIALKGGTVYAPGNAVGSMVEAIIKNKHEQMPFSAYQNGEYGVKGFYIGVPAVLGRNGVEKIVKLDLDEEQKAVFQKGADSIKNAISEIGLA